MKASRFSDAQKAFILKQGADGMPVADICRKAGISQATYFNWKKKHRQVDMLDVLATVPEEHIMRIARPNSVDSRQRWLTSACKRQVPRYQA